MSNDSRQKDAPSLTFKDWKLLKASESKTNEKTRNTNNAKTKKSNRSNSNARIDNRINNNNNFNGPRDFSGQGAPNFFPGNSIMLGRIANNFNRINNFNNNNGMHNFNNNFNIPANHNNFGFSNNGFNQSNGFGYNNFNAFNNNNRSNNFDGNNFNGPNPFGNCRNRFNGNSNGNNFNLPDNFFASDGMYRQKDFMQKPLPNYNPFRHEKDQLIKEFNKSRFTKDDNGMNKKSTSTSNNKKSGDTLHNSKPTVYISNPKARIDGKPYIPKPKFPEENLDISKQKRKQEWKEYRDAMKPFKNREFYNAKRVVQRLGKLDPSELDEKQIFRLANAREIMFKHKTHLNEKYAYQKIDDKPGDFGEVYVLKNKSSNNVIRKAQNYGNFGENDNIEPGKKNLTDYKGFVPGGILKGASRLFKH